MLYPPFHLASRNGHSTVDLMFTLTNLFCRNLSLWSLAVAMTGDIHAADFIYEGMHGLEY